METQYVSLKSHSVLSLINIIVLSSIATQTKKKRFFIIIMIILFIYWFSSLAVGGGRTHDTICILTTFSYYMLFVWVWTLKLIKQIAYIFKLIYFIQQLLKQIIHLILVYTFAQAHNVHCISISQVQLTYITNQLFK